MPTYEYACRACGRHFEVVQSFSDDPKTTCEECGGELRRVFHPVGVMFKGSGFYSTDAKGKSGKARTSETKSDQSSKTTSETPAGTDKSKPTTSSGSGEKASGTTS